jgi:hypothetical protein
MVAYQDKIITDMDHKPENRIDFPHQEDDPRALHPESSPQPSHCNNSHQLPCQDAPCKKDHCSSNNVSLTKYFSLLVSLKDHRRTNNNRIMPNVSQLFLVIPFILLFLPILSTTAAEANAANAELAHPNAKAIQFHSSSSSVLIPVQTSVSYTKAYSDSRPASGLTKNRMKPGTIRNVNKFRKQNYNATQASTTESQSNSTLPDVISNKMQTSTKDEPSSISRPFYTKLTIDDAVAKPSSYFANIFRLPSSSTTTVNPTPTDQLSTNLIKPSKLFTSEADPSLPQGLTPSTEKSFLTSSSTTTARNNGSYSVSPFLMSHTDSGPKIRLEPFFNLLSNFQSLALGTSKEQRFSPSYQTITQSINENTKKSKANKSTKGMREKKRKSNRNRIEQKTEGPIPIPLPELVVDLNEINNRPTKSTLHPLDILNVPMNPVMASRSTMMQPSPTSPMVEEDGPNGRESSDSHNIDDSESEGDSGAAFPSNTFGFVSNSNGFIGFDKYEHHKNHSDPATSETEGPESHERRLRSGNILDNFHDQDVDLQAEESVTTIHIVDPSPTLEPYGSKGKGRSKKKKRKGSGRHVNIPPGYTTAVDIEAAPAYYSEKTRPHLRYNGGDFNPVIGPYSDRNNIKEDFNMASRYPISFAYNNQATASNNYYHNMRPPPVPSQMHLPLPHSKLRPNLHSYYDPNYHNVAAQGELFAGSNHQYNYYNGYPNSGHSDGSHYSGHSIPTQDYHQDKGIVILPHSIPSRQPQEATSDLETQGSGSDNTFDTDKVSNSNQKIGIMNSFEVFYTQYKVLAWAAFFVVTSLALVCLLVFLYVNNPPTEVVTARQAFEQIDSLLGNQQILKFLSSLVETNNLSGGSGKRKRKRFKKESMQTGRNNPLSKANQEKAQSNSGKRDL